MTIDPVTTHRLASAVIRWAESREPDFVIGGQADPYLRRWWRIPRNRAFNIYVHELRHSDDDRALHDHPWPNVSIILDGFYIERAPCWSLFITGPMIRDWGFHCPRGWVPWQQFVDARDTGAVGRGCGELG